MKVYTRYLTIHLKSVEENITLDGVMLTLSLPGEVTPGWLFYQWPHLHLSLGELDHLG